MEQPRDHSATPLELEYPCFQLADAVPVSEPRPTVLVVVEATDTVMAIRVDGYGDCGSQDGYGSPLMLELAGGRLRLIAFPDINSEEPIIIDLEGARETARKD